ncbi:DNA damage-binding protein 1a-like [Wolffia australiana]
MSTISAIHPAAVFLTMASGSLHGAEDDLPALELHSLPRAMTKSQSGLAWMVAKLAALLSSKALAKPRHRLQKAFVKFPRGVQYFQRTRNSKIAARKQLFETRERTSDRESGMVLNLKIGSIKEKNGLLQLDDDMEEVMMETREEAPESLEGQKMMHARLGHPSFDVFRKIFPEEQTGKLLSEFYPIWKRQRLMDYYSEGMNLIAWRRKKQDVVVRSTAEAEFRNITNSFASVFQLLLQVLLATGGGHLVYLEIGDGKLREVKHIQLEYDVSCLDINPIDENSNYSSLAAVGMWTDISVRVFSLPALDLITKEHLGGEIIPRSVLLCKLEGVPYLLCALGDGHLFNFLLNASTGELSDRKKVSLGTQPITLRTFASKGATHVFAASDRPTVIYSSNKKLLYSNVNLKEVSHMCPFNSAAFPDSLAIAKEGELSIGTIDDIQKLHIRSIPLGEHARRICHQEQSRTFAICSVKQIQTSTDDTEMNFVRLLDDQTFDFISTYALDSYEYGCSILSCSFADDNNTYYCVGTAYVLPEEPEPNKGRILVFAVEEGKLQLIAEKETKGAVFSLNAFNGKLLAAISQKIQLYRWVLREDGSRELQSECGHHGHILALFVQTRGDFIIVGDLMKSISLLLYKHEEGAIEERARDYNANWMTAAEILDDDVYLGAENSFNLFTVRRNSEAATDEERGHLDVVGEFHLGEFVNRFRAGSLVMRLPDSEAAQIQTVIFGSINGVIGVVASLPQEQYAFLEKLQGCLAKVIKGVGGLSHEQWRSFNNEKRTAEARNFLDGDLIESFLDLSRARMLDVSTAMGVSVEDLCKRVEELTRLH